MIGGAGEKKTLRMVAQYADESNLTSPSSEMPRKLDALAAHCERLGRDRSEITVSQHLNVCIADTHDEAYADMTGFLGARGFDLDTMDRQTARPDPGPGRSGASPDEVGEQLEAVLASGIDGITCSLPANGWIPDRVELLGATAGKVLGIS